MERADAALFRPKARSETGRCPARLSREVCLIVASRPVRRILLLFTAVYANGGIQRFNQTFIAAMSALGVRCDVLSMHDTEVSIGSRRLVPNVRATGFSGSRVRFARATMRAVWSRQYDWVVIGHINLLTLVMGAIATRPLVVRPHRVDRAWHRGLVPDCPDPSASASSGRQHPMRQRPIPAAVCSTRRPDYLPSD